MFGTVVERQGSAVKGADSSSDTCVLADATFDRLETTDVGPPTEFSQDREAMLCMSVGENEVCQGSSPRSILAIAAADSSSGMTISGCPSRA